MESPTGLVPEHLMYPERKREVIAFLQAQPWPGDFKRRVLEGWAVTVGIRLRSIDFKIVEASGVDQAYSG